MKSCTSTLYHLSLTSNFYRSFHVIFVLCLTTFTVSPTSYAQNLDCQYQLSNWSDQEALTAIEQWKSNGKQQIIVQYGAVITDMGATRCKAFKRWLARAEALKSSYRVTLYYGKHPKGKEPQNHQQLEPRQHVLKQGENLKTHHRYQTQAGHTEKTETSYSLTPGVDLNINRQLWREGKFSDLSATSTISTTTNHTTTINRPPKLRDGAIDKKTTASIIPLSRKPPTRPANYPSHNWISVDPTITKEPQFTLTVFSNDIPSKQGQVFTRLQQWQFDQSQDKWLPLRANRKSLALNHWYNLHEFFAVQDNKNHDENNTKTYATAQRGPLSYYYFYIDRP